MDTFAPIALFAFKRPAHTRRLLESLARNPEFAHSRLHVFCDGARDEADREAVEATRALLREWPHPNKHLHEAPINRGLARSVIDGVGSLCASDGKVIVVEDDLVVSPNFLAFLNAALKRYESDERVMQISGHMFPIAIPGDADAVFLPFTTSWGWATWARAWRHFHVTMNGYDRLVKDRQLRRRFNVGNSYPYFSMLRQQRLGRIDSWAIHWHLSVFMRDGMTLYPSRSLVDNEGFDGSGTHCGPEAVDRLPELVVRDHATGWSLPNTGIDARALAAVASHLRSKNSFWQRARRQIVRRLG